MFLAQTPCIPIGTLRDAVKYPDEQSTATDADIVAALVAVKLGHLAGRFKLGIEVAQSTVAKYMARSGRGRSQTWKTFQHKHASGIGAMDFLIVPTVGFRLLFVLVILQHNG